MKIFIINLKRSAGRRYRMERNMKKANLEYEFFEAVDGYALSKEEQSKYIDPNHNYIRKFYPGEIGCIISHYLLLKKIVEQNIPYALIMEDDVELSPRFPDVLREIEPNIQQGDLISFYASFPEFCKLKKGNYINSDYYFIRPEPGNLVVGAVAYIVTLDTACKLIQTILPMHNVVDDWRFWSQKGLINDFKIVFPHPVDLSDTYSDLMESYGSFGLKIKRFIVDHKIPVISELILKKRKKLRWQIRKSKFVIDNLPPKILYI